MLTVHVGTVILQLSQNTPQLLMHIMQNFEEKKSWGQRAFKKLHHSYCHYFGEFKIYIPKINQNHLCSFLGKISVTVD